MTVTYGFYNSIDGDRRYEAEQLSAIFDGLIADGVYETVGEAFRVQAASGNTVTVGTGRAWFNSTWTLNSSKLPITLDGSDVLLDRYDAIVLEVNKNTGVRQNRILHVKGSPSSSPKKPKMVKTQDRFQYPLAYIFRPSGSSSITNKHIESRVGTSECPFVVGIIKSLEIDWLIQRWEADWNDWFTTQVTIAENDMDEWYIETQAEFERWFEDIDELLRSNDKGELAGKLKALQDRFEVFEKHHSLTHGLLDSDSANILDSSGRPILGQIKYKQI